jgi:hypothetical protein
LEKNGTGKLDFLKNKSSFRCEVFVENKERTTKEQRKSREYSTNPTL